MQYRSLDKLGRIRAIGHRPLVTRVGRCKADLVVDDDVNRTARSVTTGIGKVKCFHHYALSWESCVTVHHHTQNQTFCRFAPASAILPRTDTADNDRINNLKVRRIEFQCQVNMATVYHHVGRKAIVVLDIAGR